MRRNTCYFGFLVLILAIGPVNLFGQGVKPRNPENLVDEIKSTQAGDRARDLYYVAGSADETRNTGLRVKLYEITEDCDFIQVSPYKQFIAGERLRFGVESNTKGYLYVVQRGSSGQSTLLFPHPAIQANSNQLPRGNELVIPGKDWFQFDQKPGVEELTFIVSNKKLDIVPYLIPSAPTGEPAASQPLQGSIEFEVITILQGRGSRDLIYSPSTATTPVIAENGAIYDPVYAVNTSTSKNGYCVLTLRLNHGQARSEENR